MKTSLKYVLLIITGLLSQNHAQVVGNRGDTTDYAFNPQNYNFVDSPYYDGNIEIYDSYDEGTSYEYESGSGVDEVGGTYKITFKLKFKDALEDDSSQLFERVAGDIHRSLSAYISAEMTVPEDQFVINVLSMESGPNSRNKRTQATVDIQFERNSAATAEELSDVMLRFSDTGRIGRKKVTAVTEASVAEIPGEFIPPAGAGVDYVTDSAPVDYHVVINYQRAFDPLLTDATSSAFQMEKRAVEEEVNLFLLASQSVIDTDLVSVNVNEFQRMNGDSTGAFLTVSLSNTPPQQLDAALQALVGKSLGSKWTILSAELNGLPSSVPEAPDFYDNDDEPIPPDEPPAPTPTSPIGRGDEEPIPPDYDEEPIPPDFVEIPDHCATRGNFELGSVTCSNTNSIGSVCRYECNVGSVLRGASQVTCQDDGEWDGNEPFCEEIFCQPSLEEEGIENGRVTCSQSNRLASQCIYGCSDGYQLAPAPGNELTPIRNCLDNGEWFGTKPVCEIISIDCEIDYRPWTECINGLRTKEGYVVREAVGNGIPCPSPVPYLEEECQDCVIDWGEWGACSDGQRSRSETVVIPHSGAGEPCPELRSEQEPCVHCEVQWGNWSECSDGQRTKSQFVAVEPVGDGAFQCLALQILIEACRDCVVEWGDWEDCSGGIRIRHQFVAVRKVGAGKECPPLKRDEEECIDCEVQWGEWTPCRQTYRLRSEIVTREPVGAGAACPVLNTEREECRDCELSWGEWGECYNKFRSRAEFISSPVVGAGSCPSPGIETEDCVDCEIGWGDWSECIDGERKRYERITVQPVGAGEGCPFLQTETEPCVHCEVEWEDWGECEDGLRTRKQYEAVQAVGPGGILCLPLQTENETCIHCEVEWGEWSECNGFERTRALHISVQPVGPGANACPHLHEDTEDCYNCELAWDVWTRCENGTRRRSQFILIEPEGGGKPCEFQPDEVEECVDCQLGWGEWGNCVNGRRVRKQIVITPRVGVGAPCRKPRTQKQICRKCVVEWGDWSECRFGLRERAEYVATPASEGGESCPMLQRETEICIDCELAWADWSACVDGERVRFQYVSVQKMGAGKECPELGTDSEACIDCEVEWGDWSDCANGQRVRDQYVNVEKVGAGRNCSILQRDSEICIDCKVGWLDWSPCSQGLRTRSQFVEEEKVGAGKDCPELQYKEEECVDCLLEWGEFGECANGEMTRSQFVSQSRIGAGEPCPVLLTNTEACSDCEVDWGEWSSCEDFQQTRTEEVIMGQLGTGQPCPDLRTQRRSCNETVDYNSVICRYVREFLGYGENRNRRDILLLGDESGSIGWVNYEKIKNHFKAIAREIQGGIGPEHSQLSMMSFAGWTRTQFGFDAYTKIDDIFKAIDRSTYHGGHRSKIGQALIEADTWMFQQAEGMRSFPGRDDDDITHEILIATDGCRTSSSYFLEKGLKTIRRRGIKLSVLGVDSHDPRCKIALREMLDGQTVLYEVGDWEDLDEFTREILKKKCQS